MSYKRDQLDEFIRLANEAAAKEIDRLRAQLAQLGAEGRELLGKYDISRGGHWAGPGIPHDIHDFLEAI